MTERYDKTRARRQKLLEHYDSYQGLIELARHLDDLAHVIGMLGMSSLPVFKGLHADLWKVSGIIRRISEKQDAYDEWDEMPESHDLTMGES